MMDKSSKIIERDEVVIRFSGDSGDGMQLTGTLFSNTSAVFGNDISTFPDYPAEIRAVKDICYDQEVAQQLNEVQKKTNISTFEDMVNSGDVWEVE